MPFPEISPYVPFLGPFEFDLFSWHVGPVGVRWYALAYIAGIVLGWLYTVALTKNEKLWGGRAPTATRTQIDDLVLWITLGVVLGGRLGSVLFYNTSMLWTAPQEILQIWNGGMSFHGGLLGVTLALIVFARANRIDLIRLADLVAPCVPIALMFGRLANFVNAELWGRVTDVPWGMVFCNAAISREYNGCPAGLDARHPSQLYEAALEGVVLFLLLRWATHKAGWLQRRGAVVGLFLLGYGVFRILLEGVREPDAQMPDFPLGLTMGTMLSIPMAIGGAWLLWRALRRPAEPQTAA